MRLTVRDTCLSRPIGILSIKGLKVFNLKHLATYTPPVCRVIARRIVDVNGKRRINPISSQDISKVSGLSIRTVFWISEQDTWDSVKLGDAVSFLKGCCLLETPVWRMKWFLSRSIGKSGGCSYLDRLPRDDRIRVSTNFKKHLPLWAENVKKLCE